MATLDTLAKPLDYLASRTLKWARARATRLSEAAPDRALALLAAAAKAGDADAAFALGEHYLEGKGTLRQAFEAARWYRRAAEAGHVGAQCQLAHLCLLGLSLPAAESAPALFEPIVAQAPDYHSAALWARRAAEAGAPAAQAMLGYILSNGPEGLRDPDGALGWYRKSAEQDCPQGHLGYGLALMQRADTADKAFAACDELVCAAHAGLPMAHYLLGVASECAIGAMLDEVQARRHYKIAAESGHHSAQARLGVLLLEGRGGAVDLQNGETWLRRAALGGDCEAAARLGDIYARGGALPPNYAEAANWFRMAAEAGHKAAARSLGMLYLIGAGVVQDPQEAATWFECAVDARNPDAQAEVAALRHAGATLAATDNPPPVHEWFECEAEQGDLVSAFNYAVCLAEGLGVPRNDERAAFWLRRAAEVVVKAQYWYGRMLADGRGVPRDEAEAVTWFARAADAGLPEAQVALGERHVIGRGVPRDREFARSWFLRAAQAGHPAGMFALGMLHADEQDGAADYVEARRWFVEAAGHDHPTAYLMLARYAVRGLAGPRDLEAGRRWFAQAASLGAAEAADELSALDRASQTRSAIHSCADQELP